MKHMIIVCLVLKIIISLLLILTSAKTYSQTEVDERAVINFDKGLGFFAPDSSFGLNLRFRMQNRIGMNTVSASDLSPSEFEANVRRLRLRFDGFLGKSGLTYYLQLSFSRGDQDWDASGFPGIVRDAMVFYNFSDNFYLGMGQGKLPGNRQRVISSGQQQFADRSLVNALFNIDRDFGLMAYYTNNVGQVHYNLKGAISSGEGRNIQKTDKGLAYTARMELLPMGQFLRDGDFSEGDLERHVSPRVSIAATYSYNDQAIKANGQRGAMLLMPTDITSIFVDMIAKYQGWAWQSEYAHRSASVQPSIPDMHTGSAYTFTGNGWNSQLSYVFHNYIEVAGRYTYVVPHDEIKNMENTTTIYTIGATKYMNHHRNKLQINLSHQVNEMPVEMKRSFWNIMMQVEIGI
jgi:phosphate-selective porin OprO and OprP